MLNRFWIILVLCSLVLGCASCQWRDAKAVIAMADSIDQTQHVIWDDTAALGQTIRQLDNPFGRLFMRSTLGKAYYYMGRNLEDSYQQVAEAAECYIEADRLHIDDPIYRGRVNSCMGYICAQNNSDSLALIFEERAGDDFKESGDDWYIAQSLLNISYNSIDLKMYVYADSMLQIASSYHIDNAFHAKYYETRAFYYDMQQKYDSALSYYSLALEYWQDPQEQLYSCLKMMQIYDKTNRLAQAIPYAQFLVENSNNPNHLVNAYYHLLQEAKLQNNTEQLSVYAHARADAQKALRKIVKKYAEAIPLLEDYANNPHPLYWVWFSLASFLLICVLLFLLLIIYRKKMSNKLDVFEKKTTELSDRLIESESLLTQHKYDADLAKIMKKYPSPPNQWNEYPKLKKDLEAYLCNWLVELEQLGLTNREKVLCVLVFVYPHLSMSKIADYMNITEKAVRVLKTRIVQKLGIASGQLHDYLRRMINAE